MLELLITKVLVLHILSVMIAVGAVAVTDYVHILGLRSARFEKQSLFLYPLLSKLIIACLVVIYVTGALLVWADPAILESSLFWLKLALVIVVTINGYILHRILWPQVKRSVLAGEYPPRLMKQAALAGSISIVTWIAIVVVAVTKTIDYAPLHFAVLYGLALAIAYLTAVYVESHKRKTHTK